MPVPADPTELPLAAWAVFRPVVLARLGPAKVDAIERFWREPARGLAEPQTYRALLAEMAHAIQSSPITPAEQAALVQGLPSVAMRLASAPSPAGPATLAIRSIIDAAIASVGDAVVAPIVAPLCAPDVATRWIPSASDGALEPKYGFERHAAFIARFLATAAEAGYKPMLRAGLDLTWIARGESKKSRNTLGALIDQCEKAWDPAQVSVLIDRRIALVRNSEDHRRTLFDAATEVVTFVNERDDGTTTTLAMSKAELAQFTGEFMARCSAMHAGFVRS